MVTRFVLLGLLVLLVVSGMSIQSAYANLIFNLDELVELRTVGATSPMGTSDGLDDFRVDNIECRLKHTTIIYFADGTTEKEDSNLIISSPLLNSFIGNNGKEVIRFVMQPKVFCGGAFDGFVTAGAYLDSFNREIADISQMRVYANLPSGQRVLVHQESITLFPQAFKSGDPNELPLGTFHFTAKDVYENLPPEDYSVTLEIQQVGDMHFTISTQEFLDSNKSMWIPINPNDISSFYSGQNVVDVPADDDNDGIPNSADNCPTIPETYNGYQDSDGCPDTVPSGGIPEPECAEGKVFSNGFCIADPEYMPPESSTPETPQGITEPQCLVQGGVWTSAISWNGFQITTVFKCTIDTNPEPEPEPEPFPECPQGTHEEQTATGSTCVRDGCFSPKILIGGVCSDPPDTRNCEGVQIPINDFCPTDCPDSDGDSICDFVDDCTFEKETFNGFEDFDGCADVCPENTNSNGQCVPFDMCAVQISCSSGLVFSGFPDCDCVSDGTLTAEEFRKQIGDGRIVPITTVVYSDNTSELFIGSIGSGSVFPSIGDLTPAILTGSTSGAKQKQVERIDFTLYYVSSSELNTSDLSVTKSSGFGIKPTVIISSVQQQGGVVHPLIGGSQSATFGSLPQGIGHGAKLGSISFSAKTIEQIGILAGIGEGNQRDVTLNFETLGQLKFTKSLLSENFVISDNYVQFSNFIIFNEKDTPPIVCTGDSVPEYNSFGVVIACVAPACPTCDDDGDGIINSQDQCPDEQEDGLGSKPFDGCKDGTVPPTQTCPDKTVIPLNEICTQLCSDGSTVLVTVACPTPTETRTCDDGTVIPISQQCQVACIPQLSLVSPCDPTITCKDPKSLWSSPALYEATCNPEPDFDPTLLAYGGIALVFIAIIVVIIKRR